MSSQHFIPPVVIKRAYVFVYLSYGIVEFRHDWRRSLPLWSTQRVKFPIFRETWVENNSMARSGRTKPAIVKTNAYILQVTNLFNSLDFIDDQEIQLHHLGVVSSINAWDPITEEAVLQALELILNPSNYPMMIMCNLGRHRTGRNDLISSQKNS